MARPMALTDRGGLTVPATVELSRPADVVRRAVPAAEAAAAAAAAVSDVILNDVCRQRQPAEQQRRPTGVRRATNCSLFTR